MCELNYVHWKGERIDVLRQGQKGEKKKGENRILAQDENSKKVFVNQKMKENTMQK